MTPKAMLTALTLAAVVAAGASTAINAQGMGRMDGQPGGRMGPMVNFAQIDANGDGTITADELKAWQAKRVEGLDANKDGFLTEDEIVQFRLKQAEARIKARVAAMFQRHDLNGDGKLSAAEMMAGQGDAMMMRLFNRADANNDGKVTQAEWDAAKTRFQRMGQRAHRRDGDRNWRGMMQGQQGQPGMRQGAMQGRPGMGAGNCDYPRGMGLGAGQNRPPMPPQTGN